MSHIKQIFSKTNLILYGIILGIVFLDLLSKFLVDTFMDLYESVPFIEGFINFTYIANKGGAWGMLAESGATLWLAIFSLIFIIIFFSLNAYYIKKKNLLYHFSFCLIVGGTFGNMIDRFSLGYVRDFIEFDFINFPVFNIADICLVVGVFLFCLWYILSLYKECKINSSDVICSTGETNEQSNNIKNMEHSIEDNNNKLEKNEKDNNIKTDNIK